MDSKKALKKRVKALEERCKNLEAAVDQAQVVRLKQKRQLDILFRTAGHWCNDPDCEYCHDRRVGG